MVSSQNDIEERVDALLVLKAQGYSYNKLAKVAAQTWKISERQAKRYLALVKERELALVNEDSDEFWSVQFNELNYLRAKAMQEGQLDTVIKVKTLKFKAREQFMQEKGRHGTTASPSQHSPDADAINSLLAALEEDVPVPPS